MITGRYPRRTAPAALIAIALMAAALYALLLNGAQPAAAAPPTNDNLAGATTVLVPTPGGIVAIGNNAEATMEASEPTTSPGCGGITIGKSVWYRWQSPSVPGTIVMDTFGSQIDSVLAVYTGTTHPLTAGPCNDYVPGASFAPSALSLTYAASTTYYIQVGTYFNGGGGEVILNMTDGAGIYVNTSDSSNTSDTVLGLREAMLLAYGSQGITGLNRALSATEAQLVLNSAELGVTGQDMIHFSPATYNVLLNADLPTWSFAADHVSGIGANVTVDGQGAVAKCFRLSGGSSKITGLVIRGCDEGVRIEGSGNRLGGSASPLERNVIQNNDTGVFITGSPAVGNILVNNYIGTTVLGNTPAPNLFYGVAVFDGASNNSIGLAEPESRNVISGNGFGGILISGSGTTGNAVRNNFIGIGSTGTALPNLEGVAITNGATGNVIGPQSPFSSGERNVISGNTQIGVALTGTGTTSNTIRGNYVGLDQTGTFAIANGLGVSIFDAWNNTIGGSFPGDRNYISGNKLGMRIDGFSATDNIVRGNTIGLNTAGAAVGNFDPGGSVGHGILLNANSNFIGGPGLGDRNVISGNEQGLSISGGQSNVVQGNFIGTNTAGTAGITNFFSGVQFAFGATGNLIGGDSAAERNVISGNTYGLDFFGDSTANNVISGNYIGTNASGTGAVPNAVGVSLFGGPNQVGGDQPGEGNVISGNTSQGIRVWNVGAGGSSILGNRIGTTHTGSVALGNGSTGIAVDSSVTSLTIGDTTGGGNVIAFNGGVGVDVSDTAADTVTIRGNAIYSNTSSGIALTGSANHGVPAPVITGASATVASGTACPGCTIDVYSDATNQGRHYLGSAVATLGGTFVIALGMAPPAANLTATATEVGATSQFSATFAAELCNGLDDDSDFQVDEGHPNADGDIRKDCVDNGKMAFYPTGHALTAPTVDCTFAAEDIDAFKDTDGCPEPDNDNDGFPDATDACPGTNSKAGADGALGSPQDTNLNGIRDGAEAALTTDDIAPGYVWEDNDGVLDTDGCHDSPGDDFDGDGLTDDNEVFTVLTDAGNPDTDADAVGDGTDNCPLWANGTQSLPLWPVPANDVDCDGFNRTREQHVGTDPTKHCNENSGFNNEPDAWPTDFNDSRLTDLSDVVLMGPTFNKLQNQQGYNQRFDLDASNSVLLGDVIIMGPFWLKFCT